MKRIRLVVVEDNRLLRDGLTAMLKEQPDISVVASVGNGEALLRTTLVKAHVVLLDLILGSQNSLQLVSSLLAKNPRAKIIVMDLGPFQPALMEYVGAGIAGFVLKDATFDDFLLTISKVANGEKVLPPSLTSSLLSSIAENAARKWKGNPFRSVRMSIRERQVVELIAEGLSNKQIASRLTLSVDTVKSHVHNILEKLALHTRLEIANYHHGAGSHPTSE
jgi:DNA-binding NarL/FixJ family response regulator